MNGLIQVAGIIDNAEATMLAQEQVDWLGFPLRLPSGKDDISEADATAIIAKLPEGRRGVLISYLTQAADVSEFCSQLKVDMVQLHGDVSVEQLRLLKALRPDLTVLKSLVVKPDNLEELLQQVDETAEYVDMFITDTFNPATGAKGATGLTHDWDVSAALVERSSRPLMMAGGLNPDNVVDAIKHVRPAAVDAHTGLEGPDGRKSLAKVQQFVERSKQTFELISA